MEQSLIGQRRMTQPILIGFAIVFAAGIVAQWLAWRFNLPAILVLLVFGILVGPVTGLVSADALLGEAFRPIVSIAVAIVLFEGGLHLKLGELRETHRVVRNLLSFGVLTSWTLITAFAFWIFELSLPLSLLLGAILVVTGPTVVIPLLQQMHLKNPANSILKWEGILVDPIGAMLAVLIFEAILSTGPGEAATVIITGVLNTLLIATAIGVVGAFLMIYALRYQRIPEHLYNFISLTFIIGCLSIANVIQEESGLLAVTVMGMVMANQRIVSVANIVEFKANLQALLVSGLFIMIATQMEITDLQAIDGRSVFFLLSLVLVARPACVIVSTLGSSLSWREKLLLCWMAPRGIVAAAVVSIIALHLTDAGYTNARILIPEVLFVIMGSILIYGLTTPLLARLLNLVQEHPQGVIIVGAHPWAASIARCLKEHNIKVILVDKNRTNIHNSVMSGLPCLYSNILAAETLDKIDLNTMGYMLTMTPNDAVNSLAAMRFSEVLGKNHVYQLAPEKIGSAANEEYSPELLGSILFYPDLTFSQLDSWLRAGAEIKAFPFTGENAFERILEDYAHHVIPLFFITTDDKLLISAVDREYHLDNAKTMIALVGDPLPGHTHHATVETPDF